MEGGDFMKIKNLVTAVVYGAAAYVGIELAKRGIYMLSDPCRKAKLKAGFKQIKDAIVKKNES